MQVGTNRYPPKHPAAHLQDCPMQLVVDVLGDKWTPIVLHYLGSGTCRYGQLHRAIPVISKKMLTQTLRELEARGLVSRTVHAVVPPKVDYKLTELGQLFMEPVEFLNRWSRDHASQIAPKPPIG